MSPSIMWFRRDLRLSDNPALLAACKASEEVVPLFVLDDELRKPSCSSRLAFLYGCLRELDEALDGNLVVRSGDPTKVIAEVVDEVDAGTVFCAEDFGPYARERDEQVEAVLGGSGRALRRVDSAYAVEPGAVTKSDGTPYQVFTPYSRAWQAHGWGRPHDAPHAKPWVTVRSDSIPADPKIEAEILPAGEKAGRKRLRDFLEKGVDDYDRLRDFPAADATSRLSAYLRFGCIHPRQVLDELGRSQSHQTFRTELCWREFYADVLFHHPESTKQALQPKMRAMKVDHGKRADERFEAWAKGMTGYPMVDAGMRQLLGEGFMHNRVRMIVASFLIKDLHIDWSRGAAWFMQHLTDGDLASNTHGWQWVAGTGTDAAPYFRIFNPVTQGKKFDPEAEYIRTWVPELRGIESKFAHEPWKRKEGLPNAYPERIVDHDDERKEALARYGALR